MKLKLNALLLLSFLTIISCDSPAEITLDGIYKYINLDAKAELTYQIYTKGGDKFIVSPSIEKHKIDLISDLKFETGKISNQWGNIISINGELKENTLFMDITFFDPIDPNEIHSETSFILIKQSK